jgi:hypothetical protein
MCSTVASVTWGTTVPFPLTHMYRPTLAVSPFGHQGQCTGTSRAGFRNNECSWFLYMSAASHMYPTAPSCLERSTWLGAAHPKAHLSATCLTTCLQMASH